MYNIVILFYKSNVIIGDKAAMTCYIAPIRNDTLKSWKC